MSDQVTVPRVRLSIFEHFLKDAQAPTVEELMTEFSLPREKVTAILDELAAARHIALVPGSSRILMAEPADTLVYLALRPTQWWDNIVTTCSNTMVFFASPEHRDASDLCAPPDQSASLTPDQVHALSGPIYTRKLELDYARPSRDELLDHFASIGLTGDYWRI